MQKHIHEKEHTRHRKHIYQHSVADSGYQSLIDSKVKTIVIEIYLYAQNGLDEQTVIRMYRTKVVRECLHFLQTKNLSADEFISNAFWKRGVFRVIIDDYRKQWR